MTITLHFPDDMTPEEVERITGTLDRLKVYAEDEPLEWTTLLYYEIHSDLTRCATCEDHNVECGLPKGKKCKDVVK